MSPVPTTAPMPSDTLGEISTAELLLLGFGLLITILMVAGMILLIIRFAKERDES